MCTKAAPALAAGCAFLVKPAPSTSLITARVIDVLRAHFPAGLIDAVIGDAEVGRRLIEEPGVARVAFTGSTAVGREVALAAARGLKVLSLELGGCDPFVLLDDADVASAVKALMRTRFYNAGQVCVAPKRLIAQRNVAGAAIEMLEAQLARIRVGPGIDANSTMGPLHLATVRERLEGQIDDAVRRGARLVGGGRPAPGGGNYENPSLLIDVPADALVRSEETFGPALAVVRVASDDEAIAVANETPFGLGASVWGGDLERVRRVAGQIPAGYTWINHLARVYDEVPFGGVRDSGFGREHGREAFDSYCALHTYVTSA